MGRSVRNAGLRDLCASNFNTERTEYLRGLGIASFGATEDTKAPPTRRKIFMPQAKNGFLRYSQVFC